MKSITRLRISYITVILLTVVICLLGETDHLTTDFFLQNVQATYYANLLFIALAFAGMFFALRLFVFAGNQKRLCQEDILKSQQTYNKLSALRIGIMAAALIPCTTGYYLMPHTTTPMYCALVSLITCIFCWPSLTELENFRKTRAEKKE